MTNITPRPTFLDSPFRFAFLALLGISGFVFGVVGLLKLEATPATSTAWFNAIYHALQLFLLEGDYHRDPIPWTLQLGRFLCGGATITAVVSILFTVLNTSLRGLMSRIWGGHILILGPGDLATAMARQARSQGKRVVLASTRATANKWRADLGPWFPLLAGKTSSTSFLKRCKASRASRVLILGDNDADNLAVAAALDGIHRSRSSQGRKVLISNPEARASLDAGSSFLEKIEVVSLNVEERRARQFFDDHPLDFLPIREATKGHPGRGVTLVMVGWGSLAEELLLQAGRIGHFSSGVKLRVIIGAPGLEAPFQRFLRRWPAIEEVLEIERTEHRAGDPGLRALLLAEFEGASKYQEPISIVVTEGPQVSDRLGAALWVQGLIPKGASNVQVIPDLGSSSELGQLVVSAAFQKDHANVCAFNSPDLEQTLDLEMSDSVDELAKGLHEQYISSRRRSRLVDTASRSRPAEQPWRNLEETYRAASRALADHLPVKLRAIGCEVVGITEGRANSSFELSVAEVELLSKLEHQRWCAERLLAGWAFHPKRDNQLLHHDLLVTWEELSEADRYLDRDVVKGAIKALMPLQQTIQRCSATL